MQVVKYSEFISLIIRKANIEEWEMGRTDEEATKV